MSADPGAEWSGPWANDAQRLFRMLQQAAQGDPAEGGHSAQSHDSPAECRYCPFCQALALIRRSGPDALDQIAQFAAGLAATLRATTPDPGRTASHDQHEEHAAAAGDPATGSGWAASVDDVPSVDGVHDLAGQNADGSGSGSGVRLPPDQPLVPPMVRIDITD